MDAEETIKLEGLESDHVKFMKAIVQSMNETPYILKGGTALMLGYGLDRFSEDLDFDSTKKINMENKIKKAAGFYFNNIEIDIVKNTDTVQRYRVGYSCINGRRKLKIETSFRQNQINDEHYLQIDGMKIYKIECLLDKKLKAAHDGNNIRTVVRDLYDIWFIVKRYKENITNDLFKRLSSFCENIDILNSRYEEAYMNDDLINSKVKLEDLLLGLESEQNNIKKTFLSPI